MQKAIYKRGFTLIETMIAVSMLAVAVAGPLVLSSQSLSAAQFAKDGVTAYYLGEEAIETVRALRDKNSYNSSPWLTGLDPTCSSVTGNKCVVDAFSRIVTICPGGVCPALQQADLPNGEREFRQGQAGSAWSDSRYTREVQITPKSHAPEITAPDDIVEAVVTVTMRWQSGPSSRVLVLTSTLFDWK